MKKHSNQDWSCEKCKYVTDDPQNLKAHVIGTHGDNTRYRCKSCSKGFNHYMQLKRHLQSDTCKDSKRHKRSASPEH